MMAGLILYLFNFSIVFVYSISQTQCNHDFYCPQQGFEFSAIWNKLFEEEVVSEKVTNMLRPMPFKLRLSLIPINSRITFNYILVKLIAGEIKTFDAVRLTGLSERQIYRKKKDYKLYGVQSIPHKNKNKSTGKGFSNNLKKKIFVNRCNKLIIYTILIIYG